MVGGEFGRWPVVVLGLPAAQSIGEISVHENAYLIGRTPKTKTAIYGACLAIFSKTADPVTASRNGRSAFVILLTYADKLPILVATQPVSFCCLCVGAVRSACFGRSRNPVVYSSLDDDIAACPDTRLQPYIRRVDRDENSRATPVIDRFGFVARGKQDYIVLWLENELSMFI
jgi:hypothetical protein